ncbi:MAG: hypothetical protein ACK4NC_03655 [Candidatus Gracilibacteria bacterium]
MKGNNVGKGILEIIASVLFIISGVLYIKSLLNGKETYKVTWIIWAGLDVLGFVSMFIAKSWNLVNLAAVMTSFAIAFIAYKYGQKGWSTEDKICFVMAILGILLWGFSTDPLFGIISSQFAMLVAFYPMGVHNLHTPEEDPIAWLINWFSCLFLWASVDTFTWEAALQPAVFVIITSFMFFALWRDKLPTAKKNEVLV